MTTVVVLSGGLDSTCALAVTGAAAAVSLDYGQRHVRELSAAADVAADYRIPHRIVNLRGLLAGSALLDVDRPLPEGRYDHPSMAATVVPGRNLLLAAAAVASVGPGDALVFGVHAGDHPIYPDCRPGFWSSLTACAAVYDVAILTPFLHLSKAELLTQGVAHGAPVGLTWSCYAGGAVHCGRCGTCVERAEAFALAGLADPTTYADPEFWRQAVRT